MPRWGPHRYSLPSVLRGNGNNGASVSLNRKANTQDRGKNLQVYLSWSLMMQSEPIIQYDTWNLREMVLNKNNSMAHYTPVTTSHFSILNMVGDTQEATCPMPILLLFYLGNRWVFFSTPIVQRERERVGKEGGVMKKREREGWREGYKEGGKKSGLYFPACPAAELVLFRQRGNSLRWLESPSKEVQKWLFNEHERCLSLLIMSLLHMCVGWLPVGNHLEGTWLKIRQAIAQ